MNGSVDVLYPSREAKGAVDVPGVSGQYHTHISNPVFIACQTKKWLCNDSPGTLEDTK